jgi:uncharacterized protein
MMVAEPAQAPGTAREYHHLLRGPRFAWWRPLLTLLLVLPFALLIVLAVALCFLVAGQREAVTGAFMEGEMPPADFAFMNLCLAALIPAALLATRAAHRVAAGYLSSTAGRIRWRWLARCMLLVVPVYVAYALLDLLFDWPEAPAPAQQGWLLLVILTTTPLQAAGEEYLFRGLFVQNLGAWFRNSHAALLVSGVLSTVLFTAAHGSTDPWIVADLALGSIGSCILIWRTGGLEAAIVLHAANNVVSMAVSVLFGGWGEGFVDQDSKGEPLDALLTLVVVGVIVPLVLREARRRGVQPVCVQQSGQGESVGGLAPG